MKMYLLRHGEYDFNTGQLDDFGREHARVIGQKLAGNVRRVISSPAKRAVQTAKTAKAAADTKVEIRKEFAEHGGPSDSFVWRLSRRRRKGIEKSWSTLKRELLEDGRDALIVSHLPIVEFILTDCGMENPCVDYCSCFCIEFNGEEVTSVNEI